MRRKESVGHPAFSIVRTLCRPAHAGSDSGSVDRSSGLGAHTGSGGPMGGFWTARVL